MASKEIVAGFGVVLTDRKKPGMICAITEQTSNESYGKKAGLCTIPMGRVNSPEYIEDSVKREVYEETGYNEVKLIGIVGIYQIPGAIGIVYLAEVTGEPDEGWRNFGEVGEVQWVADNYFDNTRIKTRPAVRTILRDYRSGNLYPLDLIKNQLSQ